MTPDERERLSVRLSNLNNLRTVYEVIADLAHYETAERDALPFQFPRFVLQDFAWRVEGLGATPDDPLGVWVDVAQQIAPHIRDVLDAHRLGDETGLFNSLNRLSQSWAMIRGQMR